jgi:hypothetical protein
MKRHNCEQMKRAKLLQTNNGKSAFFNYQEWTSLKRHQNDSMDDFLNSRHFKPMMRFAEYSRKMAIPNLKRYMEVMVDMDIHPKDWCQHIVYDHYITNIFDIMTLREQCEVTVDTIFELSKIFDCETGEVFRHIEPSSTIRIIQARKLMPCLLLTSKKFMGYLRTGMTREQQVLASELLNPKKWDKYFKDNPEDLKQMKSYIRALDL